MVCLGLKPGAEGWKAQTNPLSWGGTPNNSVFFKRTRHVTNAVGEGESLLYLFDGLKKLLNFSKSRPKSMSWNVSIGAF